MVHKYKVTLANTAALTDVDKEQLLRKVTLFAEFKKKEAEVRKLKAAAEKSRDVIEASLNRICENLDGSKDFEIIIEGETASYLISSKSSSTTYYSQEDIQEKITKNQEELKQLRDTLVWASLGKEVIKSEPRITFNIKSL